MPIACALPKLGAFGRRVPHWETTSADAGESPVVAQILQHQRRQRDDPVLMAFAIANDELVLVAEDVVNGQSEAFAQAQSAAVDELERRAIAAQANGAEQIMHLLAGEHGGKDVVILGADLGEDAPQGALEQLDKEELGAGQRLADGLGLPVLLELDEKQVVAQMRFLEGGRIALEVLVKQAHRAVVRVTGALGVVAQCEQLGELRHRRVGMLVIDRISGLSAAPCAARSLNMAFRWNDFGLVHRPPVSYLLAMQSLLASRRPGVSQATTPRSGLVQRLALAESELSRSKRLSATGAATGKELERASAGMQQFYGLRPRNSRPRFKPSSGKFSKRQSALRSTEYSLSDWQAWAAHFSDSNREIASIYETAKLQIWVEVNQRDVARLYVGQPVEITLDAEPGKVFTGEVSRILLAHRSPKIRSRQRSFSMRRRRIFVRT